MPREPRTLREAIQYFSDAENCRRFMISVLWPDGAVRCPGCGSTSVAYLEKAGLYFCNGKHPRQKFSLKAGTIFAGSPIRLEKWLPACWLILNSHSVISSYELARALGVTQKTAWSMLHRISEAISRSPRSAQTMPATRKGGTSVPPPDAQTKDLGFNP